MIEPDTGLIAENVRSGMRHAEDLRAESTLKGVVESVVGRYLGLQVLRGVAASAGERASSEEEGSGIIVNLVDSFEGGFHHGVGVEVVQVILGLT